MIVSTSDEHGRDAARELLGLDDRQFRMLIEDNVVAFTLGRVSLDPDGKLMDNFIVYANPAFEVQSGVAPEAVVGRWMRSTFDDTWLDIHHQVLSTQRPATFVRFHEDSGRWYEVYKFPVGPDVWADFFHDVTDRQSIYRQDAAVFGNVTIDYATHEVLLDGRPLELTASEFILLATLSRSPGVIIGAGDLLSAIRGFRWSGDDAALDVHISRLRRKLGEDARHQRLIRTVRGVGYLFAGEATDGS